MKKYFSIVFTLTETKWSGSKRGCRGTRMPAVVVTSSMTPFCIGRGEHALNIR